MVNEMTPAKPMAECHPVVKSLGPKDKLCVGAWNVRTMYETSKTAQVTNEMQNYKLIFFE
jgi:hypothetical protein